MNLDVNDVCNSPAFVALFESRYKRRGDDECWVWGGTLTKLGYGNIGRVHYRAHRVAWAIAYGFLDPEMDVLHRCDNRRCVNPNHLFVGDHVANMADMAAKKRSVRGEAVNSAVLTPDEVNAIRLDPRFQRDIAADYGISQNNVSRIKRGETWRHLPWPTR